MASVEALRRASKKYDSEKVERIPLRVSKGKKTVIQDHATKNGESVNGF